MIDTNDVKVLKKRGRKPKNKVLDTLPVNEELIDSEKEIIIAYLPINLNEIEKKENDQIFIKSEFSILNTPTNNLKDKLDVLSVSNDSENFSSNGIYINKINIYKVDFKEDTKCWWCKNSFNTPNLMLPENYFDGIFYCIGNFCSFNCKKAYNIDLNDPNVWKRESLINLEYYLTYNRYKKIDPDRKSTRLNSSHITISYAVFCLKKKKKNTKKVIKKKKKNKPYTHRKKI